MHSMPTGKENGSNFCKRAGWRNADYTKNVKKCVQKLLRRYYDESTAAKIWEKIRESAETG